MQRSLNHSGSYTDVYILDLWENTSLKTGLICMFQFFSEILRTPQLRFHLFKEKKKRKYLQVMSWIHF